MITLVEPQKHLVSLWGKQKAKMQDSYRLMRYVLRVEHDGKILLHNVVTGQLVVLEEEEASMLEKLPVAYSLIIEPLVADHYLVPLGFDEHRDVDNLRTVLRKLNDASNKPITQYKILPTTACNARCYYCFEHGIKTVTMSERTAQDVVNYIESHCDKAKINITWFGGEPTIAATRIDQISRELLERGIKFRSDMISNGYLFDEEMIIRAKNIWKLNSIQISVDGTEANYNRIKAYKNVSDNPYERVLHNVGLLLDQGIHVGLRMNFDLSNYNDFEELLKEAAKRYKGNKYLQVYAYPIIGEYADHDGIVLHGTDIWFAEKVVNLNNIAREAGLYRYSQSLPFLTFIGCEADRKTAVVITPEGKIGRCGEHVDVKDAVGDVKLGILDSGGYNSWRVLGKYEKCVECTFYPKCLRLSNCSAGDNCYFQDRNHQYIDAIKRRYDRWVMNKKMEGGIINDV